MSGRGAPMRNRVAAAARRVAGLPGRPRLRAAGRRAAGADRMPRRRHRNGVQCGMLERPLDPARPEGRSVDIHYVVVPAMARRKLADPVFLLAGGPGQSAIALAPR